MAGLTTGAQRHGGEADRSSVIEAYAPNFSEVPLQALLRGLEGAAKVEDRRVESINRVIGEVVFPHQPHGGSNAQNIKQENSSWPKDPRKEAALGPDRVGLGFDLVCGLFVHEGSVAQKQGFNRRKRSERRDTN
jgi:hypothetical protein